MNQKMTLKEYLLSQGVNAKQERLERKVKINNEIFTIKIDKKIKTQLLEFNAREIFVLAYKSLLFLKNTGEFNIVYLPKDIVLKGKCIKSQNNTFEIMLTDCLDYDENNLSNEKNIAIVDKIDSNVKIETF